MTRKNYIRLSALGGLLTLLLLSFIFRKSIFTGNKDKIYHLLHYNKILVSSSDSEVIYNAALIESFYDRSENTTLWTDKSSENEKHRKVLIEMLHTAEEYGLDKKDYHYNFITRYDSLAGYPNFDHTQNESENELVFTDAAITFLLEVAYGKEIQVSYNGIKYDIDSAQIVNSLVNLLDNQNWKKTLKSLEPSLIQYQSLKKELNRMQKSVQAGKEADTVMVSVAGDYKRAITLKLQAYNLISHADQTASDIALHSGLMAFQKIMNLTPTGELDEKTIAALNHPLSKRIEEVKKSLNYWRWTARIKQPEFIFVNIPAARLQLVSADRAKNISMKVIVGKPITQTPPFAAYIYRVITYPHWTVPLSIATKEMLPKIIKNVNYLQKNDLSVLSNSGAELNPYEINWSDYSANHFPFTIRQSTGCDNSLGILKFDINSPYAIYLHDTNLRNLFEKENRFLSHGCIRVEKPIELAHYILGKEFDSDIEERLNKCLKGESPDEIRLKAKLPVLIFYLTADVDENGTLKFYPDVYDIENKGFSKENVASPGEVGLPD